MTKPLEKIKQLIALGEKATEQGLRVDVPNDEEAICLSDHLRTRIIYLNDMTDCLGGYEGKQHLANFFVRAANTRADLAEFVAEYESMEKALKIAGDGLFSMAFDGIERAANLRESMMKALAEEQG